MVTTTTDNHPAVAVPRAAVNTGPLLAGKGTQAQNQAVLTAGMGANPQEKLLQSLYPKGEMAKVEVKAWATNPNPLVKSMSGSLGAWTNSSTLIYYNAAGVSALNQQLGVDLAALILYHESIHIVQFAAPGGTPPASFEEMVNFELKAYPKTQNWTRSQQASKVWPVRAQLMTVRNVADGMMKDISSVKKKIEQALKQPGDKSVEQVYLEKLAANDDLPKIHSNNNGSKLYYTVTDLYAQDEKRYRKRWEQLGY